MIVTILYYALIFISGMFCLSKAIVYANSLPSKASFISRNYCIITVLFTAWCFVNVMVGVAPSTVVKNSLLLVSECIRMMILIFGAKLCAFIINRNEEGEATINRVTSELLYVGIAVFLIRLFFDRGQIHKGIFGPYVCMESSISLISYIIFNIIIIFFFGAFTYMYYYSCNKKREFYVCRYCIVIIVALIISLIIEVVAYSTYDVYIPTMYIGICVMVSTFKKLIEYKSSIDYKEENYSRILNPAYQRPAFVCDDEGKIIFENTRAFVLSQTSKDEYIGKYLTDVFDITDFDKKRLVEPRITQTFDVYCKYPKILESAVLRVRHRLDRFGDIFATEVEYDTNVQEVEAVEASSLLAQMARPKVYIPNVNIETVSDIREENLIRLIETQKSMFEKGNKELFLFNIKGISKLAAVLGNTSLEELCERIQIEILYGEWDSLNSMIIELDRQYETLKMLHK